MKFAFNTISAPQITRQISFPGNSNRVSNSLFNRILTAYQEPAFRGSRNDHQGLTAADYLANPIQLKSTKLVSHKLSISGGEAHKNYVDMARLERPDYSRKPTRKMSPSNQGKPKLSSVPAIESNREKVSNTLSEPDILEKSINQAATKYNLPPKLIKAVIKAESNFDASAVSSAGAQGLMQLMPATAEELGVKNPFDIAQNIDGGSHYLRKMLNRFNGDVKLALAAYNAGPGTVEKYDGNVPYRETQNYVKRVIRFSTKFT